MANKDADDFFSDDDLSALPQSTLVDLERKAVQSTQRSHPQTKTSAPSAGHLPSSQSNKRLPPRPNQPFKLTRPSAPAVSLQAPPIQRYGPAAEEEYGVNDEVVLHLNTDQSYVDVQKAASETNQPPVKNAYGSHSEQHVQQPERQTHDREVNTLTTHGGSAMVEDAVVMQHGPDGLPGFGLMVRIQELERENAALQRSIEDANSAVISKAGEITIVRTNQEKIRNDYERKLFAMQELHNKDMARQKAELDAARAEKEKLETSNRFLEHDMVREAGRGKAARKTIKDQSKISAKEKSDPALPIRSGFARSQSHGDGFSVDDMIVPSAAKSAARIGSTPKVTTKRTPRGGSKRKRTVDDSPIKPLQLSHPIGPHPKPPPKIPIKKAVRIGAKKAKGKGRGGVRSKAGLRQRDDHRIVFLDMMLDHKMNGEERRTFDALAAMSFPSTPEQRIASTILEKLSPSRLMKLKQSFSIHLCRILVELWRNGLRERFYQPIPFIMDLLLTILGSEPARSAQSLIGDVVPLAIATCDLVAIPIMQAKSNQVPKQMRRVGCVYQRLKPRADARADDDERRATERLRTLQKNIDVTSCLSMLETLATSGWNSKGALSRFWKLMQHDFVLLMLNSPQPLPQIAVMLKLLTTSRLQDTFGCIVADDHDNSRQARKEADLVDRLLLLLSEEPRPPSWMQSYNAMDIAQLRLGVLSVLESLCHSAHGSYSLAAHRLVIARLIKFLDACIRVLYTYRMGIHKVTCESIDTAVRILHHLVFSHPEIIDLRAKLNVIVGGIQRHLLSLSRLAFCGGDRQFEAKVSEQTAWRCFDMLNDQLSPEEGESLQRVFYRGNSAHPRPGASNEARKRLTLKELMGKKGRIEIIRGSKQRQELDLTLG